MVVSFEHRIGYCATCVIPSRVLIDAESTSGLSFIRVQRQLDAVYLVRVASSAEQFTSGGWYTELLSEDQLRYARPCQRRGYQFAEDLLDSQPVKVRPVTPQAHTTETTIIVATVEVSERQVQAALRHERTPGQEDWRMAVQQAWLQVSRNALLERLYTAEGRARAAVYQQSKLVCWLHRWQRSHPEISLVRAVPAAKARWTLTVQVDGRARQALAGGRKEVA